LQFLLSLMREKSLEVIHLTKPGWPDVLAGRPADCQMLSIRHPTRSFIFGYSRLLRHLYVIDCGRHHAISNAISRTGRS